MVSQQYISIIRLLQHCDIPCLETIDVFRARKVLQAEFNLRQNGFIEVDGFSYSRQDVFEELDRPDFITRMIYHRKIWNSTVLLELLEKNTVSTHLLPAALKIHNGNRIFEDFFSPYFSHSFTILSRNLLANQQFDQLHYLLVCEDFVQGPDRNEAFRPIRTWLDDNIRLLRNVNKQNYSRMREKLLVWINGAWGLFINTLPPELYDRKNDIAVLFVNITVSIQKGRRKDCRKISSQLVHLTGLNEELTRIIPSNHQVYQNSRWKARFSGWWWAFWIFFAISRLISTNGCSDDDSRRDYINMPQFQVRPGYRDTVNTQPLQIDSEKLYKMFREMSEKTGPRQ